MTPMEALEALGEEDLMQLVRTGDARAFEVVYDRHASAGYSLAYRMVGSRGGAEDVLQEAFLSLWRSRGRYDPSRGSVRMWVLGVVRNRAIDALRRSTVRPHVAQGSSDEHVEAADRTTAEAVRREDALAVRAALATLPADQGRALELAYFGGFTQTEIAQMLDTPVGTIKGRMRLGLRKLRDELGGAAVTG